jgi:autotransporter-associated beta strand protein
LVLLAIILAWLPTSSASAIPRSWAVTISFAGASINAWATPLGQDGKPITLAQAANDMGYVGFDWVQSVTALPGPSPFRAANNPTVDLAGSVPFLDPQPGGYRIYNSHTGTYDLHPDDSYPFYYNPNNGELANHESTNTLSFYDAPADQLLPPGGHMGFATSLVGIVPGCVGGANIFDWSWISTFNGTSGGVSKTKNDSPVDAGSGTGGIAVSDLSLAAGNYVFNTSGSATVSGYMSDWWSDISPSETTGAGLQFTITEDATGVSSITKTGTGTLLLADASDYSGGTTVAQGTLQVGNYMALGRGGLTVGAGGTVDLNGVSPFPLPSLNGDAGAVITDNSVPASSPSPTVLTVDVVSGASTFGGAIVKGSHGQDIALVKDGSGTLTLSGASNYSGGTAVYQGTLNVTGTLFGGDIVIAGGAALTGCGTVSSSIAGEMGSTIVATGNLCLGDRTSYKGFNHAGTLAVGANNVTLNSAGFANLGILTTLNGGTISAPNGVSLGVGCNLSGSGAVNGKIAAGYGSTINATGSLILGDSTKYAGFVSDGELYTNNNTVTLNSNNAANNRNAVVLGALTQLDGGTLVSANGILLENGKNLVTTDAGGIVTQGSGPSTSRFLNRGSVQGPSSSSNNWLIFNMLFKGSTGQTAGRIGFLGGYSTGDCPGINTQYGATLLGGNGTEFDIGGKTPGNSDNNYGQLNILTDPNDPLNHGDLTLLTGTSLKVVDWNGFVPSVGDEFTILTWDGMLSGSASLSIDPLFANHGIGFVSEWNSHSLVLDAIAVPEPSTFALFAAAIGFLAVTWRRYQRRGTS